MRTIILLAVVALAFASPIDDKTLTKAEPNPDISKLPLKKDDPKIDPVNAHPHGSGVQAHPLHQRETVAQNPPRAGEQPVLASGQKAPASSSPVVPQSNGNQQPIYKRPAVNPNSPQQPLANNQRQPLANNQKQPLANNQQQPLANNNNQRQPQPSSNFNGQKTQQVPLTQNNGQTAPLTSQSSRVRREAPKPVDTKATPQNASPKKPEAAPVQKSSQPAQPAKVAPKSPAANNQQKPAVAPVNTQQKKVKREAPKPADAKATPQVASNVNQKKDSAPVAPAVPQKSGQNSRITREAPKHENSNAKESKPTPPPGSVYPERHRDAREAPKPIEAKPAQPLNPHHPQPAVSPLSKAPLSPPSNSRPVRESPNPSEQSKIVPSAYATKAESSPSSVAKTGNAPVTHDHNSQNSQNVQVPSSKNQPPQFVHPIPVDQILKKPAVPENQQAPKQTQVVGVTKTETIKAEISGPLVDHKFNSNTESKVASNDQKPSVKAN